MQSIVILHTNAGNVVYVGYSYNFSFFRFLKQN